MVAGGEFDGIPVLHVARVRPVGVLHLISLAAILVDGLRHWLVASLRDSAKSWHITVYLHESPSVGCLSKDHQPENWRARWPGPSGVWAPLSRRRSQGTNPGTGEAGCHRPRRRLPVHCTNLETHRGYVAQLSSDPRTELLPGIPSVRFLTSRGSMVRPRSRCTTGAVPWYVRTGYAVLAWCCSWWSVAWLLSSLPRLVVCWFLCQWMQKRSWTISCSRIGRAERSTGLTRLGIPGAGPRVPASLISWTQKKVSSMRGRVGVPSRSHAALHYPGTSFVARCTIPLFFP